MPLTPNIPPWLEVMRAITGLSEYENGSNPKIEAMAAYIGRKFPGQASYASQYDDDSIAWCGVAATFCLAACTPEGISGPFGPTDTDKWMWAQSFVDDAGYIHLGSPVPGAIVIMSREGGGHVTMFEEWADGMLRCRGGNQSNCVNVSLYDSDTVICYCWPKDVAVPEIPVEDRPMLERGDSGPDVLDLQQMIPHFVGAADGDFGPTTEDNVLRYQASRGLEVDGVVGDETWRALYDDKPPLPPPAPPPDALTPHDQAVIRQMAVDSQIANYSWSERGVGPDGWIMGLSLAFAQSYLKLKQGHPAIERVARANTHDDDDVCQVYRQEFDKLGMSNETGGSDVLRHIYAFLIGMAIRESSGAHCCGRDQSAENFDEDTCESGMFQQSHNSFSCDSTLEPLMDEYLEGLSPGYLDAFSTGVSCSSADWDCYGDPDSRGYQFQELAKNAPAFSAEACAVGLRVLKDHWGPVKRKEVELRRDADDLLKTVQLYVDASEPQIA